MLVLNKNVINVEAIGGDMNLGGRDIDQAMAEYCIDEFNQLNSVNLTPEVPEYKEALHQLTVECERVKILL